MKKRKSATNARDVALFRYSLVRPLLDARLGPAERGELVRSLVSHQHVGPAGELVWVSRPTLHRWVRALRLEGFEALVPRPRQVTPRTRAELLELAVALKRERPARTATQVARIMRQTHGRGPSARTLQRHFARLGLHRAPEAGRQQESYGRFEADFPDELWLSDGLHAGMVRGPVIDGRETVLIAILDDHSRYVVYGRWGFAEDTLALQALLHDAVKTHGCPVAFYCDHGSAYTSGNLAWSLAVLDIKIVHSRVGRPQGRGKIERWNGTCRTEFLVEIETGGGTGGSSVSSLSELNRLFHAWLHQVYHQRVHTETRQTPAVRYHHRGDEAPPVRQPAEAGVPLARDAQGHQMASHLVAGQLLRGRRRPGRLRRRPAVQPLRSRTHRGGVPGPADGHCPPSQGRPARPPRRQSAYKEAASTGDRNRLPAAARNRPPGASRRAHQLRCPHPARRRHQPRRRR